MPERGRSPGAKGTAFPASRRPQRPGTLSLPQRAESGTPARSSRPAATARAPGPARTPSAPAPIPQARDEPAAPQGIRLSKLMAERGMCSRREADEWIANGWVFAGGERISQLGTRVAPDAVVTLAPAARSQRQGRVTILLHKPVGYVSGQPEDGHAPAVSLVVAENRQPDAAAPAFDRAHLRGLAPAGRLDIDSTGLLVFTQDGRVARRLIGEDSNTEKEYLVRVEGRLGDRDLALLNHGLELDGRALRPAWVEWLNADQLRFVLTEGRKRQIRRMCELVGLRVTGLKRVRIGGVRLGDLPLGQWRYLRSDEQF